jgi:NADH:ubiquinone oxidoreductase subunit 5 (subunit L)/multisubunit Na+/H+ antiporter MnhA subunit
VPLIVAIAAFPALAAIVIAARVVRSDRAVARVAVGGTACALVASIVAAFGALAPIWAFAAIGVAMIAVLVTVFAARSMHGSSIPFVRFFALLSGATSAALAIVVSSDLRVLACAWIAAGLCTSGLLGVASGNPEARRWQRRHVVIERVGDLGWIIVLALVWHRFHTFDIATIAGAVRSGGSTDILACALLLVACSRSAIVPFHGWLPNAMEAPTAVSAFMHAGIVNGAGLLLAKTAFVLASSPTATVAAVVLGGATALLGTVVAAVRAETKRRLAWSTVAQMGFLVLQCGCGAFAAAILHLVLHGGYKATAFLGAASAIEARAMVLRRGDQPYAVTSFLATLLVFAAPTVGLVVVALAAGARFTAMPAWPLVSAVAWAAGVAAMRAAGKHRLRAVDRAAAASAIAGSVACYLGAVVVLEAHTGIRFPSGPVTPAILVAAGAVVIAALVDGIGVRFRAPDALYTYALVEGTPVPFRSVP